MNTETVLLIGGPRDGARVTVYTDARDYCVRVAKLEPIPPTQPPLPVSEVIATTLHVYRREHIHFPDHGTATFFIHESLSPRQAMEKLLEGYKPS